MRMNNDYMDKTSIRKRDSLAAATSTQPRQFFRASSRLFCLNGEWYFQTREADHGPFTKREAAELALDRYVNEMQDMDLIKRGDSSCDSPTVLNQTSPVQQLELNISN